MGAKAPASQRFRNGGFKCEFCGRNVMTLSSLRSHQRALHATALKDRDKLGIRTRSNNARARPKLISRGAKKSSSGGKIRLVKMPPVNNRVSGKTKAPEAATATPEASSSGKIEFKCPKCDKYYPVYFSAMRHIKKNHCLNSKGIKVSPDDPDIIKPIRTELCPLCDTKFTCDTAHHCHGESADDVGSTLVFVCTSCKQKFNSMKQFDFHLPGLHGEGVESMFFPTRDEFTSWKDEMETQTNTFYLIMGEYNSKRIYRCSNSLNNEDITTVQICPSTVIYQEFSKGIQVHFYREHSGHDHDPYILIDKYKSYSITGMLQQASGYTNMTDINSDENDIYLQFKTLMESIILDAAKINIDTLKVLIGRALDMTSVLTNYDEDGDTVTENRSVLSVSKKVDDGISKALDSLKSTPKAKRNIDAVKDLLVPVKRLRRKSTMHIEENKSPILQKLMPKPIITNSFSLANEKDTDKILKELDEGNVKKTKVKPNSKVDNGIDTVKRAAPESPPVRLNRPKLEQSPSSFNDSYKDFVVQTYKKSDVKDVVKRNTAKKTVVKTKMGQYKPNTSASPKKKEERSSLGKKDVEYVVQEQENDCNILILKM